MATNPNQQLLLESYLHQLRLPVFAQQYQPLALDAARSDLSYERYLLVLAEEEVKHRERNSIERSIKNAHFPVLKELSDFDFGVIPALPRQRILELAGGAYISRAEPLILIGNPGLGKSHVATALGIAACRQGKRVQFYNAAGLVNELLKAQAEYRLSRFMTQALRAQLIVLDELGFIPFTSSGAALLFQFCAALYERVSVIVTSNLRFGEWGSMMGGDERMSAALLDRLTHRATILEFVGSSFRLRQQLQRNEGAGTAMAAAPANVSVSASLESESSPESNPTSTVIN